MGSSKKIIGEQVLYKLNGGVLDNSFPVQLPDVYKALEQKINAKFQIQQFNINLPSGETIPDNLCVGVYENVPVVTYGALKSKCTLPVMPISLPKGMGIALVYDPKYPDSPFIPLQRGMTSLLRTDVLLNDLMGLVSYEIRGNELIFNKKLFSLGVTEITIELVVMDISQYSETDPLPIPASMESDLITELTKEFIWVTSEAGLINNYTNLNQNQPKQ